MSCASFIRKEYQRTRYQYSVHKVHSAQFVFELLHQCEETASLNGYNRLQFLEAVSELFEEMDQKERDKFWLKSLR